MDYILAGGGARSLIKSVVEMEGTPWMSHRSSRVEPDRRPPAIEGWKLMMPTAFPPRSKKKQAGNEHSKAARQRMAR